MREYQLIYTTSKKYNVQSLKDLHKVEQIAEGPAGNRFENLYLKISAGNNYA
jgi:hypothetical protein